MDVSTVVASQIALTQARVQTALLGRLLKLAQTVGVGPNVPQLIEQAAQTARAINRTAGVETGGRLDGYA